MEKTEHRAEAQMRSMNYKYCRAELSKVPVIETQLRLFRNIQWSQSTYEAFGWHFFVSSLQDSSGLSPPSSVRLGILQFFNQKTPSVVSCVIYPMTALPGSKRLFSLNAGPCTVVMDHVSVGGPIRSYGLAMSWASPSV